MRTVEKRLQIMRRTGKWPREQEIETTIPDHDNPAVEVKLNTEICAACHVPFIKNRNQGGVDPDGVEDKYYMVCPLCGLNPY